ncbi:glycoside hydrolase family 125 protein [Aplosporella prunicola CBS 121167]|uniref:Glycoside hydrolase family 125 protein n=1 Tax=Aplosporella prunicola CBS 121167 TaxID=1176127 RepID=A0A6A6BCB9_9PEZI|nr:glycoside hydrolase family 125 protein [Aplosporella prunicola CBS 121167]KAF2140111.1 glycoside hydrolase family 125 protein [Aplosporella prunicola CBS 121167]
MWFLALLLVQLVQLVLAQCPDYLDYSKERHAPYSTGPQQLPYQRPAPACRTFNSSDVEETIARLKSVIRDPDLARLFENAFPNTLDTAIKWHGSTEELTFIITGDINAMWLRDSANQLQSYRSLLRPSSQPDSLAALFRGAINLHARYLLTAPYCNSFQPPVESAIPPDTNSAAADDTVTPPYSNATVFECKYELDSLAAFLQLSADYHAATNDTAFFGQHAWARAVDALLAVVDAMTYSPTYAPDGRPISSPYTFSRRTTRATETLANNGLGNPVANGTGLVRSAFRPSDDATLFQLFVPANMMLAAALGPAATIAAGIGDADLAEALRARALALRNAIAQHAVVRAADGDGDVYAFEVDGFGSANLMDDANVPSLLSAPFLGFLPRDDPVYQRTRARLLSDRNPYFMRGPVISAVGGPHQGPGYAWPMASIMQILTSDDEEEIVRALGELLRSTGGLGLIHESVNSFDGNDWTRQWFSWANGLFGQMILDLETRKPEILAMSFQ